MNKKIHYIPLILILCFSAAFFVYPMRTIGLSDEAQGYIDYLSDKYGDDSSEPNGDDTSEPTSNESTQIHVDLESSTLIDEQDLNDYDQVGESVLIPASPELLEKIENEEYQYNPPVVNYWQKKEKINEINNN